jgi:putative tryptophan/tyrosine transport system substrate-binding protein
MLPCGLGGCMRRREFIKVIAGSVVAWPLAAQAQQPSEIVPKVGFVYPGAKEAAASRIEAIISGLRVSGYTAPAQIELVARTAEGDPTRIIPLVEEIIAKNVNLIIANGPPVLHVARSATQTIPIVAIDLETDPVASGIAASLGHPGGNITGVFLDFPDFTTKWIELLVENNPKLSRIAVLWDPITGSVQVDSFKKAAGSLNIQLEFLEVRRPSDFQGAFSIGTERGVQAMVMLSSPLISANVKMLAELSVRHRLPAITLFPDFARTGGLMAYGPNLLGLYRRAGILAGKVLRGTNPADLPIERPTKFELVVNLRTATALGLSISPSTLLRADEVID